jgi:hypothetical protein
MNKKCLLMSVMVATAIAFISCNDDNGKIDEISDPPLVTTEQPVMPADTTKAAVAQPIETASTSEEALNPAHGQPGHRCDIAVGAPLSTAPALTSKTADNANTTEGALNPAHGQPGHRCDIAVGAPLNSAPLVQAKNAAANDSSATTLFNKPVYTVDSAKGPLNPAHGQPGHRCDIAVGAPLNSAPNAEPKNQASNNALVNNQSIDSTVGAKPNSVIAEKKDSLRKQ